MTRETWGEFFKRELKEYDEEWAENKELLEALETIMEEHHS